MTHETWPNQFCIYAIYNWNKMVNKSRQRQIIHKPFLLFFFFSFLVWLMGDGFIFYNNLEQQKDSPTIFLLHLKWILHSYNSSRNLYILKFKTILILGWMVCVYSFQTLPATAPISLHSNCCLYIFNIYVTKSVYELQILSMTIGW